MHPRALARTVVGVLAVMALSVALIYALASRDPEKLYQHLRAVTYAVMALTFATVYRYFED